MEESRMVVEQLMKEGSPIAVDMEGITTGITGLIQVRDVHGNFSFFRPRKNPALYQEGGLAKLLESPHILKIMHASTGDAASVYRDGVKMWNVYVSCVTEVFVQIKKSLSQLYTIYYIL